MEVFWCPVGLQTYAILCDYTYPQGLTDILAWKLGIFPISGGSRAVGHSSDACRCFQRENRPCQVSAGDGEWAGPAGFEMVPSRFSAPCLTARHCAKHASRLAVVSPQQHLYLVDTVISPPAPASQAQGGEVTCSGAHS